MISTSLDYYQLLLLPLFAELLHRVPTLVEDVFHEDGLLVELQAEVAVGSHEIRI